MKYLIAGLGNLGEKYAGTRHNIGFDIINHLAADYKLFFTNEPLADITTLKYKGRSLILIKPNTYMNLSGKAVKYYLEKEKIPQNRMLVIVDDIALETAKIRIKKKGGNGGHNGLKSIEEYLNSVEYPRLRFGIGNNFAKGKQVDYVLGKWTHEEKIIIEKKIPVAINAILSFVSIGIEKTMNMFNE